VVEKNSLLFLNYNVLSYACQAVTGAGKAGAASTPTRTQDKTIMPGHINAERLAKTFIDLCEIDSPSNKEAGIANRLRELFSTLGADALQEDDSATHTGADCGNLLVRFDGRLELAPVFFCCHMDTVQPGEGVRVVRRGDIFSSRGDTILGADDKSGIAIFIEVMQILRENNIPHGPVEFLFTTSEEIGLLGAKALNFPNLRATLGYALDTTGTDRVVIGAPAANRLLIEIIGLAAHAGLNPEKGINAIQIGAQAITRLALGRLDDESTANIGIIAGGTATNIIPDKVVIKGEVRSHSQEKLLRYTATIREQFEQVVDEHTDPARGNDNPALKFTVKEEYPMMKIELYDPVILRIERAAARLNRKLLYTAAGGGSDANIFCSRGRSCAIIGTGMNNVHSTDEFINLQDMVRTAELVLAILTV
jgi:tripeptide aminopeptidase